MVVSHGFRHPQCKSLISEMLKIHQKINFFKLDQGDDFLTFYKRLSYAWHLHSCCNSSYDDSLPMDHCTLLLLPLVAKCNFHDKLMSIKALHPSTVDLDREHECNDERTLSIPSLLALREINFQPYPKWLFQIRWILLWKKFIKYLNF